MKIDESHLPTNTEPNFNIQEDDPQVKSEKFLHRVARFLSFPIFVFAIVLLADKYLPYDIYHEAAESGSQTVGVSRKYPNVYHSYMKTPSFVFEVPNDIHINYPYYEADKPVLEIGVSKIFHIPTIVRFVQDNTSHSFAPLRTVHNSFLPWSWLLLISSSFTAWRKDYTLLNYSLCFLPLLLLGIILMMFWM